MRLSRAGSLEVKPEMGDISDMWIAPNKALQLECTRADKAPDLTSEHSGSTPIGRIVVDLPVLSFLSLSYS